ncbi:MAG: glucokinase, partial [Desulfobacteraceae bacterium]
MEAFFDFNILVGDIGGTKTNLAIFSSGSGLRTPLLEGTFPSQQYPSLEMLTLDFLSQTKLSITTASFCVAGPVVDGKANITNLPWIIEEDKLAAALRVSNVHLYNDLLAFANAVPLLQPSDIHTLNSGHKNVKGNILILAPG